MKLVVFPNNLGYGGTEKAACRWAWGLKKRGHDVTVLSLADGPRRTDLEQHGVPLKILRPDAAEIAGALREISPEVIHAHVENFLRLSLELLPRKIPVVQTNVFGRLENQKEDAWTDFHLFVSWTSCVQAARRSFRRLDGEFFRRHSVAVYPLDPVELPPDTEVSAFRKQLGVADNEILLGRLSRPEPNKWTNLALDSFRLALRRNQKIKLLLREPPPAVAERLRVSPDADRFVILPVTSDTEELRLTLSAFDVVLHTSSIGESFGYGIAEPMNLGKPVITHSVPWQDQAQIELVRHGECGFVASTAATMADAILTLANNPALRERMGEKAREHIRTLADPETSIARLEAVLRAAVEKRDNLFAAEDLERARHTAAYLDAQQFGHSLLEQLALRPFYYRVRFHQFRRKIKKQAPG
jgi:glycosyltransferase involved in cell wall biosynthesis